MKTIDHALSILFGLFIISVLLFSCTTPDRTTTEVSVLYDVTEKQSARPDAGEILPLFALDADKWNAAEFRFKYVTDVSYNPQARFALTPGGNRLRSSGFTRDKEVKLFKDSVEHFIDSLRQEKIGRPHSSVYLAIAEELNRLTDSKAARRILVVYSDLMENTQGLSFYNKKTIAELHSNPGKVKAALLAKLPIKKLNGIEVYFVYQPADAAADDTFRQVANLLYKTLLAERGAKVSVAANVAITTTKPE